MTKSRTIRMTDKTGMNVTTIIPQQMIIKKGMTKKKAMPSTGEINRIPSWKSAHCTWHKKCNDERKDGHDDECPKRTSIH